MRVSGAAGQRSTGMHANARGGERGAAPRKVSYYIKKRGWHENQSDGTRHKQKESTVYNRAWNQLEATRGGR